MLLAIDTATRLLGIALYDGQQVVTEHSWHSRNRHSVELSPALEAMLHQAEIQATDLNGLAVAQGPGSFTGLRVGVGVAKGLAMALDIPLVAVPTLDIVAAATPYFDGPLIVVVRAGRGRISIGRYDWQDSWNASEAPNNTTWDELLATISRPTLINGELEGLMEHQQVITLSAAFRLRRAGFLAMLGWQQLSNAPDSAQIAPIYVEGV